MPFLARYHPYPQLSSPEPHRSIDRRPSGAPERALSHQRTNANQQVSYEPAFPIPPMHPLRPPRSPPPAPAPAPPPPPPPRPLPRHSPQPPPPRPAPAPAGAAHIALA